jgi:hypothetical protein
VTAPTDPNLPGGGGNQICGLADLKRPLFGVATLGKLVTQASNYGTQTDVYNGIDVSLAARFGRGGRLSGGVSTGQEVTDNCQIITDTPQKQFCHQVNPWRGQTQIKLNGTYPLPVWNLQVSGVFQNLPGIPVAATRAFTNAEIAPSLGRNLAACTSATGACTATASVIVLEPFSRFENRLNQVDVRLGKDIRIRTLRVRAAIDLFNAFNANTILAENGTYGSAWRTPTSVLGGRLVKFGAQFDF